MTVNAVTSATGTVLGAAANEAATISKLDFMSLLVAQIRNQDPLSPLDNAEFTSQIAQFTMLEELQALGEKLDDNLLIGQSLNNTAMLGLVGRKVTVEGDRTWVDAEGVSKSYVEAAAAGRAVVEVLDDTGATVATYHRDLVAGRNDITWDGLLADQAAAPPGEYRLNVSLENDGQAVAFVTLMTGPVTGLRYEDNLAIVQVGDEEYYVAEIYQVS